MLGCAMPRATPRGVDLTIATYNIKHGRGNDDRVDLARTAQALRALGADVIALQEVDSAVARSGNVYQARALGEALGMQPVFGGFFPYQGGAYGMAILSRLPVRRTAALRLPDGNEPRIALLAELEAAGGRRFAVVNVHFDWVSNDSLRYRQVEALAAVLDTLSLPVVLLGDFNDVPGTRTLQRWASRFVAIAKPAEDRFTFSSQQPTKEIDHILLAPRSAWATRGARAITDTLTSDHRAVVGRVTLQ